MKEVTVLKDMQLVRWETQNANRKRDIWGPYFGELASHPWIENSLEHDSIRNACGSYGRVPGSILGQDTEYFGRRCLPHYPHAYLEIEI
jgi:hypothetical protein